MLNLIKVKIIFYYLYFYGLGIFSIEMALYKEGSEDIYDRELEDEVARCSTPFIWRNGKGQGSANVNRLLILPLVFTCSRPLNSEKGENFYQVQKRI